MIAENADALAGHYVSIMVQAARNIARERNAVITEVIESEESE